MCHPLDFEQTAFLEQEEEAINKQTILRAYLSDPWLFKFLLIKFFFTLFKLIYTKGTCMTFLPYFFYWPY